MPDPTAEDILSEAQKRAAHAEVFEEWGENLSVRFEHSNLKRITTRQYRGVGLRVINEGRLGFASTTDIREPARLVAMALQSSQFGEEAAFEFPVGTANTPVVETADPKVLDVTAEQMVEIGRGGLEMSAGADKEYLYSADIARTWHRRKIINTAGLCCEYAQNEMGAGTTIEHVKEDGLLMVSEWKSWGHPFDSLEDIAGVALQKMRQARVISPATVQIMPVIFDPKASGLLLEPILLAVSGKLVHKGSSVLKGRIGEKIADERISILDDATVPFAPGSGPVDCEGVPARKLDIIKDGVLSNYLLDLQTAGLLGMQTTGHGHRSYAALPSPASSNTLVAPGSVSLEEMIRGLKQGVIVDQTLGAGQSNVLAGEFSVNVALGFLVEDGTVKGRVKDCMVAGNAYELLNKVEAVGSERQWLGSDCLPAICVAGLKLAVKR